MTNKTFISFCHPELPAQQAGGDSGSHQSKFLQYQEFVIANHLKTLLKYRHPWALQ
jgi:hypothetical protein